MDRVIGKRTFSTGVSKEVYREAGGQQYLLGPRGVRLYGTWIEETTDDVLPHIVGESDERTRDG